MRTPILLFAVLLSASLAWAQGAARNGNTGQRQADRADDQFEKTVPPPTRQQSSLDFAKVKSDADELVMLVSVDSLRDRQRGKGHAAKGSDREAEADGKAFQASAQRTSSLNRQDKKTPAPGGAGVGSCR